MAREECNVGSLYNWWPNLQIANSWNQYNNYSSNSSGDVDEDVSMFTNVSNDHSGVTIESFDQSVSTKEMVSETETPGADHQPWSHLVLSGSNGDFQDNRDVGDDLLSQFSSKIFPNDHLKKMESTGWDFTTSLFFNTLNNPLKESSCSVEQTQTLNKPSNPTFNHNSILNHTATGNTPFIDQSHHLQTSNFSDPKKRVNDQLPISYLFNRSTKGTSSIVTRRNVKAQRAPRNITQGKKKRSSDEESSNTLVKKPMLQHPKHSSIKTQVPKVKLTDKITALQQIVSPFGKTDTASVLWEAICYVRFLQEQIQLLMSNPYMKSNSCKDPWGNMEGDLRSRGLCLVPISFTPQIYGDDNGCDYFTPPYRGSLYR